MQEILGPRPNEPKLTIIKSADELPKEEELNFTKKVCRMLMFLLLDRLSPPSVYDPVPDAYSLDPQRAPSSSSAS